MTTTYFFKSYKLFKEILAVSGTLIFIPIGTTTIRKYYREFINYLFIIYLQERQEGTPTSRQHHSGIDQLYNLHHQPIKFTVKSGEF